LQVFNDKNTEKQAKKTIQKIKNRITKKNKEMENNTSQSAEKLKTFLNYANRDYV
jgi:uncharacterized membrane-anchored protein YhcB (DUF1043 family)